MYLVVANGVLNSVPVRLFGGLKDAKLYAKQKWNAVGNEATESLCKDAWEASQAGGQTSIGEVVGIRILRFRSGVVVGCVWHISRGVTNGNVG